MARQTVRDVTWLVFFDSSAPDWLIEEIDSLSPGLFVPVYLDEPWSLAAIQRSVSAVASADYLITTRVDSDDALARRFVEDLQGRFDHQESLYVNFLCGVQVERSGRLYRADIPSGPFISYIERHTPEALPRTVFQNFRHNDSQYLAPVLSVVGAVRWMQVIHGGNLVNDITGLRVHPRTVASEFDIDLPFGTELSGLSYVRERAASAFHLVIQFARNPGLLRSVMRTRRLRSQGTQVLPQLLPKR